MSSERRLEKLNKTLMKEIALVISREIKDPRLISMVSVLEVKLSPDLERAKVIVSIYGSREIDNLKTLEALNSSAGFISSLVSSALRLKKAPILTFEKSNAIEVSVKMSKNISEITKNLPDFDDEEK